VVCRMSTVVYVGLEVRSVGRLVLVNKQGYVTCLSENELDSVSYSDQRPSSSDQKTDSMRRDEEDQLTINCLLHVRKEIFSQQTIRDLRRVSKGREGMDTTADLPIAYASIFSFPFALQRFAKPRPLLFFFTPARSLISLSCLI
jgi:hypothetical protein